MIQTWVERCKKFEDNEIITYEKIQEVMQEEIDELRTELALQKLSDISQEIENEPSVQKSEMSTERELTDEESE